jgi:hypothetical protein
MMADVTSIKGNGKTNLPASRAAAVEQGLAYYQEIAAERDALAREVALLKSDIAAHKVVSEAQQSQLADMDSRCATARTERDQAVADMVTFRTILRSIQGQLRTFGIEHEPLVRGVEEDTP